MDYKDLFTEELIGRIMAVLQRGNTVELKKEKDKLVAVEIRRRVINKTLING